MATKRDKRNRRPRNVFSPSDNFIRPSYYLLYFDSTDSYAVALSSSVSNVRSNTATVNIRGKKITATVIVSGTLEICESERKKRVRDSQKSFDSDQDYEVTGDSNENIDMSPLSNRNIDIATYSFPHRQRRALTTLNIPSRSVRASSRSEISSDSGDDECQAPTERSYRTLNSHHSDKSKAGEGKRKQSSGPGETRKRQRIATVDKSKDSDQRSVVADTTTAKEDSSKDILKHIDNTLGLFQNNITRNIRSIEKKFDAHLGSQTMKNLRLLGAYRSDRSDVFPAEYVINGINLITTLAKDPVDFARKTLKLLFSDDELKNCTLPPKRDHFRREALDGARFRNMLEAVRIKFRLDANRLEEFYHDVLKTKLSNFLYEERRREERKLLRKRDHQLKERHISLTQRCLRQSGDEEEASF